ncbi:hypothetical protein ACFLTP_09630 [Chloroflexota bacterium]
MEDKKIKSALEIAMEKVAKMLDLTPQEIRGQKEREYGPRVEVIASRYLSRVLKNRDVAVELSKHQGEEGEIVRKVFLSSLCRAIQLDDADKSRRAIEGIQALDIDFDFEGARGEFEEISSAFNREREKTNQKLEESQREILYGLGISGSAVRPNAKEKVDCQNELNQMRVPYDMRIDKLKDKLAQQEAKINEGGSV